MKYSITTDKLSMSNLSSSQIDPFSFLCIGRVSAHLSHLLLSQTSLMFLHSILSKTPMLRPTLPSAFFFFNTSHKIPSFSQGNSSIPSTPTSSTSIHYCLLLPTASSACPRLGPLRGSGGDRPLLPLPQAGTWGSHGC